MWTLQLWINWKNVAIEIVDKMDKLEKKWKLIFLNEFKMWKNWNFETKSGILDLMEHILSSKKHIFTQIFIFSTFLVSKSTSPSIWKHFLKQSHVNNYHIM